MAAVEAELGEFAKVHPLDPRMMEARKATFGGGKWPYDGKKGWKCKTKQVCVQRDGVYRGINANVRNSWLREVGITAQRMNPTIWRLVRTASLR